MLAPGLEGLDDIPLNTGVLQKHPRFVDEEGFENGADLPIRDDGIGAMQDVEQQRFQKFRILAHALEVKALKSRERNRVLGVVEKKSELASASPLRKAARNVMPERICENAERAQRRIHRVEVFDLVKEIPLSSRVEFTRPLPLDQDLQEEREEIEIFLGRWQRERIDLEIFGFQANANIRAAKELREAFEASAQIEDEGVRIVFLKIGDEEIEQETFAGAGSPKNHGVGHIAVVEIQVVRRVVIGLQDREIFLAQMGVAGLATVKGEEKREIRVVGVEQIQGTQVEDVVAGNRREKGVQQVVFFLIELGIMDAEDFVEVGARTVHLGHIQVINHDGQGKLAKVIPVQLDFLDAFAEFPDLGFLGIVEKYVLCRSVVETDLAREGTLGVVKVAALGLDDAAHLAGILFFPFGDDVIVRFDFEQSFEDERKALRGGFFECQNLDVVIVHAQMPAMAFDGRFGKVVIEEGVVLEFGGIELYRAGS